MLIEQRAPMIKFFALTLKALEEELYSGHSQKILRPSCGNYGFFLTQLFTLSIIYHLFHSLLSHFIIINQLLSLKCRIDFAVIPDNVQYSN